MDQTSCIVSSDGTPFTRTTCGGSVKESMETADSYGEIILASLVPYTNGHAMWKQADLAVHHLIAAHEASG